MRIWKWILNLSFTVSEYLNTFTHFSPVLHFYNPWKRQKTFGFLTFSGGIECDTGLKWVNTSHASLYPFNGFVTLIALQLEQLKLQRKCFQIIDKRLVNLRY